MRASAVDRERLLQPKREREVAEVIGRKLKLPALGRVPLWARHHAGVVDEQVERSPPVPGKRVDRLAIRQVEVGHVHLFVTRAADDVSGDAVAGGDVAHRERHVGAGLGECSRGLHPNARRGPGDDRSPAEQIDALGHLFGGRCVAKRRFDPVHCGPLMDSLRSDMRRSPPLSLRLAECTLRFASREFQRGRDRTSASRCAPQPGKAVGGGGRRVCDLRRRLLARGDCPPSRCRCGNALPALPDARRADRRDLPPRGRPAVFTCR